MYIPPLRPGDSGRGTLQPQCVPDGPSTSPGVSVELATCVRTMPRAVSPFVMGEAQDRGVARNVSWNALKIQAFYETARPTMKPASPLAVLPFRTPPWGNAGAITPAPSPRRNRLRFGRRLCESRHQAHRRTAAGGSLRSVQMQSPASSKHGPREAASCRSPSNLGLRLRGS